VTRVLRAVGGCGAGPGRRLRFCGAARRTAGGVPHPGPTLLFNLKRCFAPLTCASDPGPLERLGWILREAASSRYITGSEVRPVQCTHTTTSRACLRVGRPARLDLLVAAGCGTKRQPGRRASGQCNLWWALLRLSAALLGPVAGTDGRGQPEDLGWGVWSRCTRPAGCPGRRQRRTPPPAAHSATFITQMTAKIDALDVAFQGARVEPADGTWCCHV